MIESKFYLNKNSLSLASNKCFIKKIKFKRYYKEKLHLIIFNSSLSKYNGILYKYKKQYHQYFQEMQEIAVDSYYLKDISMDLI